MFLKTIHTFAYLLVIRAPPPHAKARFGYNATKYSMKKVRIDKTSNLLNLSIFKLIFDCIYYRPFSIALD